MGRNLEHVGIFGEGFLEESAAFRLPALAVKPQRLHKETVQEILPVQILVEDQEVGERHREIIDPDVIVPVQIGVGDQLVETPLRLVLFPRARSAMPW